MAARDTFVHSVLALNWLQHQTLHLDAFRGYFAGQPLPWFLVEAANGHLTSAYPIGTAIVTFPLYVLFTLYLKFTTLIQTGQFAWPASLPDVTSPEFQPYRQQLQKLAAAIATALSVVIFYFASRIQFNPGPALLSSFIFAFATSTWTVSAQGLWQHTALNGVMVSLLLCLLKANHTSDQPRSMLLLVAGILCGLLPGIRPIAILYFVAIVLYVGLTHRRQFPYFLVGLLSLLFNIIWNIYYFGFNINSLVLGGYAHFFQQGIGSYQFNPFYFLQAQAGLWFSPNRGLLIYSPIVLFALPGLIQVFRDRHHRNNRLIAAITLAGLAIVVQYGFFAPWHANLTYGPRSLVDILPITCYLITWFLSWNFDNFSRTVSWGLLSCFFTALTISVFIQAIGAFGNYNSWEKAPYRYEARLWNWRDTEIRRTATSIAYRLISPIRHPDVYLQNLDGDIQAITTTKGDQLPTPLLVRSAQVLRVRARVRNTGLARWFGYRTGMEQGETRIRATFIPQEGQSVPRQTPQANHLFIEGNPASGQVTYAIGTLVFPTEPGNYRLEFAPIVRGLGEFEGNSLRSPYRMDVTVRPRNPIPSAL